MAESPKVKPPHLKMKPNRDLPTLPRFDRTYSRILSRAVQAVRKESGAMAKIKGFTRELVAMVPHTRERWRALTVVMKIVVLAVVFAAGAATTVAVLRFSQPSPEQLRSRIQELIVRQDFAGAKKLLHALASTPDGFSDEDRLKLVAPTQAGLNVMQRKLEAKLAAHISAHDWPQALTVLDEVERAEIKPEWALWQRAEVLRAANRPAEAMTAYARFAKLVPKNERADDALFWQADILRGQGDGEGAKKMLERLLAEYPSTDFKTSAKRLLGE